MWTLEGLIPQREKEEGDASKMAADTKIEPKGVMVSNAVNRE